MITVLHLIDDEKFTDYIIEKNSAFKEINGKALTHKYLGIGDSFKYTKNKEKLTLISNFKDYKNYLEDHKADILIIHCLSLFKAFALYKNLDNFKKIVWCLWGVDFYSTPLYKKSLYFEKTKEYVRKEQSKITTFLRPIYHTIKYGTTLKKALKKIISQADFIAPIVDEEFNLIKNATYTKAKHIRYSYGDLDSLVGNFDLQNTHLEDNILIGNSATIESNHIDAFHFLIDSNFKTTKKNNNKIITPLSYGDMKYSAYIQKEGKKLLNNKFLPLTDFMKLNEYVKVLSSCGYCIMAHKRQQALGNILLMLMIGSKVFVSKKNPIYEHLSKKGVNIFSIENDLVKSGIGNKLNKSQITHNRKIISELYSTEKIKSTYENFYTQITQQL
uniref:TDP-N-acetylfucosamine:lipid II N-acetylfucosaminyltransferase n=1 Tax=Ornithobacterium rhinotracheale TaxID=28251 RepID=UPI0039A6F610